MKLRPSKQNPLIGLSPMDGVTDAAYRHIQKKYGSPDVMITEFTHVMGLNRGIERLFQDQEYVDLERPVIGQIYGSTPDDFYIAAQIIAALGFDGVDINMGCPAKNVTDSGSGAALIRTPELAKQIVRSTRRGIEDYFDTGKLDHLHKDAQKLIAEHNARRDTSGYPKGIEYFSLSVKTRIGYIQNVVSDWVKHLTEVEPDWISVHGRTLKQMYTGQSDWDAIAQAVQATHIPVIANGDVNSGNDMLKILQHTQSCGVLVGRASYGNPWIFKSIPQVKEAMTARSSSQITDYQPSLHEILDTLTEHAHLHWNLKGPGGFVQMRKNFGWYIRNFPAAAIWRAKFMQVSDLDQLAQVVNELKSA